MPETTPSAPAARARAKTASLPTSTLNGLFGGECLQAREVLEAAARILDAGEQAGGEQIDGRLAGDFSGEGGDVVEVDGDAGADLAGDSGGRIRGPRPGRSERSRGA